MNMKRIYWLFLATLVIIAQYSCGSQDKTYGEQKQHEREVVSSFINRNGISLSQRTFQKALNWPIVFLQFQILSGHVNNTVKFKIKS